MCQASVHYPALGPQGYRKEYGPSPLRFDNIVEGTWRASVRYILRTKHWEVKCCLRIKPYQYKMNQNRFAKSPEEMVPRLD